MTSLVAMLMPYALAIGTAVHLALDARHQEQSSQHHQHTHDPGTPPGEPHVHSRAHGSLTHRHPHYPDLHHRHRH